MTEMKAPRLAKGSAKRFFCLSGRGAWQGACHVVPIESASAWGPAGGPARAGLPSSGVCAALPVVLTPGLLLCALPAALALEAPARPATDVADMDIAELVNVRVSPFEVSTHLDRGYRASNSVSGSRFDAPIRELPFAIQAFTQSFIQDQKPQNLFDIARYSPGVTYRSNDFNEGNANLAIRGFAVSATPGNVQVLRDGFYGPSIFDFTNLSRVEVVKGPASFLYGQVAPGGIVNVITKNPQRTFAARAEARTGSYGQHRVEADVTGPASETLFYRIAASHDQDIDYWKPYDAHSRNVSPSLLWQPTERFSVSLKYEAFDKTETPQVMQKPGYNTQNGIAPSPTDPNLSGVDVPGLPDNWNSMSYADYRRSKTRSMSAWLDFKADDRWNLRAGYARQSYEIDALFSGNLGMANNATRLQGAACGARPTPMPTTPWGPMPSANTSWAKPACACWSVGNTAAAASTTGPHRRPTTRHSAAIPRRHRCRCGT